MSRVVHELEYRPTTKAKWPKWKRMVFVDDEGAIYVPAEVADNETAVMLAASWDGVPVMHCKGHLFAPTWWIKREYPNDKQLLQIIAKVERHVKEALDEKP